MKKWLSALALILCLFAVSCNGSSDGGKPTSSAMHITTDRLTAVTTLPTDQAPTVDPNDTFPVPLVGEGDEIEYIPVEGQTQLKKITGLSNSGIVSSVSCWERFMLVNFYHTTESGFAEAGSGGEGEPEYEEWTDLLIIDLLTGETTVDHRMPASATAGFLENGCIYVYDYDPLTVKVYDQAGALTLRYISDGAGSVQIDPSGEGAAWISLWEENSVERLPLSGGEPQSYALPDAESCYIQTVAGGDAYLSAYSVHGENELYRLTSAGEVERLSSLDGYFGMGNTLFREVNDSWRYIDLRYESERIGYFDIEEDAYLFTADDNRFGLEWYNYENGMNECRLILCLPSSGRRTELTLVDQYVLGHCWSDDALYLILDEDGDLTLYIWAYPTAPYESLEIGIHTISDAERQNRAYADALEEKWDISICYGEEVTALMPYDYNAAILTDQELIAKKLRELSDILDSYPEGFFSELPYGTYDHFEISLCAGLSPTGSDGINTAIAISNTRGSVLMSVFDVVNTDLFEQTFAHELLHLMERRIDQLDPSLLADWTSLTPGGDSAYYFSYHDEFGDEVRDGSNTWLWEIDPNMVYFVDAYSKTYPNEDRARIFEYLVSADGDPDYLESPVLRAKAECLCEIIRLAFPSVANADTVAWEVRGSASSSG